MTESCPLCKSDDVLPEYELGEYQIAQCQPCGFEYHDGFVGGGGDDEMFSQDYYEVRQREAFQAQYEDFESDASAEVYTHWLERIEGMIPVGRILDVGSALGTFLKLAESRGWQPQGVEISRFAAEFARNQRKLPIFNGDLEAFPGEEGSFDAVTFWDSIEHVTHPLENLRTAARLLRPGGRILLTTDNFDCLLADVARLAYRLTGSRYAMRRLFIAPNRSYFTEATLRALLDECGLRLLALEKMEYPLVKLETNRAEYWILRGFYWAAKVLHRQAQLTVVAEKR